MNYLKKVLYLVVASLGAFSGGCSFFNNNKPVVDNKNDEDQTNDDTSEIVVPDQKIITPIEIKSPANNEIVKICSPYIIDYLSLENPNDGLKAIKSYVAGRKNGTIGVDADALPVLLEWNSNGSANYTVYVSENNNFDNALSFKVSGLTPYLNLYNLLPNSEYFWKVKGNETNDESAIYSFKTENSQIRYIHADGGNNMRDLGGWKTADGHSINYGKIYRGNCLNGYLSIATLTKDGIDTFVNQLGMKTEIDLRTSGSDDLSQTKNWFNNDGLYLKATVDQYTRIFSDEICDDIKNTSPEQNNLSSSAISKVSIKSIFETLANKDNYPVYMHCNVGADRTGTVSFLINGLLGVPYESLAKDFELTSFCTKSGERFRSGVVSEETDGNVVYSFDNTGVQMNVAGQNFIAFGALYDAMMKYYATEGEALSDAIENYLVSYVGISKYDIVRIKNNLIDGYHDDSYDNLIELNERQDIDIQNSTNILDLKGEEFSEITDIELNGVSLGNKINQIDGTKLSTFFGNNDVFVFGKNNLSNKVVKIPVSVITEKIYSMARFKELFEYKNNTSFGFYKLANDIGSSDEEFSNNWNDSYGSIQGYGSSKGFQGTLDGNGFKITGKSSRMGLFGVLGAQGVVKNLTIENTYYVSNQVKQHTTVALSIYGTLENVTIKLTGDCPKKSIKASNWFGLVSTSNSENFKIKNLVIDAADYYIDSLFGGCLANGVVFADSNIDISVSCKGIDEFGHYGPTKYSLIDITNLKGNLTVTCKETNYINRSAVEAEIYLGKRFEEGFTITSILCGENVCSSFTFLDGEISILIDNWLPLDSSVTFEVTMYSDIGLNLKLLVPVLIY